jgi:hypothetical protein
MSWRLACSSSIATSAAGQSLSAGRRSGLGEHRDGNPQFRDLLFRRGEPRFHAFDLLCVDGEDLRHLPLIECDEPQRCERLLFSDHVEGDGERLFRKAYEHDLEGITTERRRSLRKEVTGKLAKKGMNIDSAYATVPKGAKKAVVVLALSGPTL